MDRPSTNVSLLKHSQGIGDCPGFLLAASACDIRQINTDQLDLCLIKSEKPCSAAGVFTLNDICAAPVEVCKRTLASSADAIGGCVSNSGNANACTGAVGLADAKTMAQAAQSATGSPAPFLVCSTGRIGRPLPLEPMLTGIQAAAQRLESTAESSLAAADAILTSDTRRKVATAQFNCAGKTITVAGMAKGAGMIEPNMATMLAYLATDLCASGAVLKSVLKKACDQSFNCISIDGDMSTNDTVLLFANGHSGLAVDDSSELMAAFQEAVDRVCAILAEKIVGDGEKITRLVELIVEGAPSDEAAEKVARCVGNSLLVKTAWYGGDPNWGRLADAAGYAQVGIQEDRLDIRYDDVPALIAGQVQTARSAEWKTIVNQKRFRITLDLHLGNGRYRLLTSDLSEAYVAFNKSE